MGQQGLVAQENDMPSLNQSYIWLQFMKQLIADESIEPLPELTLDIANDLIPDISVFQKLIMTLDLFHMENEGIAVDFSQVFAKVTTNSIVVVKPLVVGAEFYKAL